MARAIMISDHVYKELTEMKEGGESYTKVIDKLIHGKKKKKNVLDFAGAWSFMSNESAQEMEKLVKKIRKNVRSVPQW